MEITRFLAMTGAEFALCREKPQNIAWMACHFSPYGTGLSNLPSALPKGSMLIVNDRIPICGHDPAVINRQIRQVVEEMECSCALLDFQRENEQTNEVIKAVLEGAGCPVGVSEGYARDFDCPVFVSPPPLDVPLESHLAPWDGREIWLEAALDARQFTVTEKGCTSLPLPYSAPDGDLHKDVDLCCSYRCDIGDAAVFTLWRTPEDLENLLTQAQVLGIRRTVGLYQQLGK